MATTHVIMMARNEADRHLERALKCARDVADRTGGKVLVTDDASDDDGRTVDLITAYADESRLLDEPGWYTHEGRARQGHYEWATSFMREGDWILSLDADETVNRPDLVDSITTAAALQWAIGVPLYEFFSPTEYRIDGLWFGTITSRLFRWQPGGAINDRAMGCGSEPTYVQMAVARGAWVVQDQVHLLHWGYVNPEDRVKKHAMYTGREGGHGHLNAHVNSIVTPPTLRTYPGLIAS